MKRYIFGLIIFISFVSLSCNDKPTNVIDVVEQYIRKNKLPITIGEEITVNNDFNIADKTSFQVFILDLSNTLANNISEGHYNDETIENYLELQRIISGFYDFCLNNSYETAIIFTNIRNENELLINYLEYNDYDITFNNDFVILDNDTPYIKFEELIDVLQKMGDIARNNIINYLVRDWNNKNEDIDLALEVGIMNVSYYMIGNIIDLFRIKGYDLKEYESTWDEIKIKITEFQKIIDDYNGG
jgi:hypothetical protein